MFEILEHLPWLSVVLKLQSLSNFEKYNILDKAWTYGICSTIFTFWKQSFNEPCYDIKPVRKEEGKSYWKIPLWDDDATREK